MKKVFKKLIFLTLITSMFTCLTVFATDVREVVKVGYISNYGVLKMPETEGFSGYGYEYLDKISVYTQGKYQFQFVECQWDNYEQMLNTAQIDIFVPISKVSINNNYVYSTNAFAENSVFIADLSANSGFFSGYEYLNDKTIGVPNDSNTIALVEEFILSKNLNTQILTGNMGSLSTEQQASNYDFLVLNSLQMDNPSKVVATIDRFPVYFMALNSNANLIADLDYAMNAIQNYEYSYMYELAMKYFNYTVTFRESFTDEELAFLSSLSPVSIGISDTSTPLAYIDEENEINGVSVDLFSSLFEHLEIEVNFEILSSNPSDSELSQYDLLLLSGDLANETSKKQSNPYLNLPYILVKEMDVTSQTIGTLKSYGASQETILYFAPNQTVIFYDTPDELSDAFNSNEINSMFITESTFDMLLSNITPLHHTMEKIDYSSNPVITFSDSFSDTNVDTFNKVITYIDENIMKYSVLHHSILINQEDGPSIFTPLNIAIASAFLILLAVFLIVYRRGVSKKSDIIDSITRLDPLTGVLNEREFIEVARTQIRANTPGSLSMLSVDIDNFKFINDVCGYNVGSKILKLVAEFLSQNAEANMPVCRRSADNFIILANTYGLAKSLRKFILEDGLVDQIDALFENDHHVTFSIGRYIIEDIDANVSHMIDCASLARMQGKNILATSEHKYNEEIKQKTNVQNEIIAKMHRAIENKEFILYYQLKVDLNELQLAGAEALVRWVSDGVIVPPNDFIPVFEDNGFIEILDYYVLDKACEFIQKNRSKKFPVISVNISGLTMMRSDLIKNLTDITKKYGVKPTELDLEITESAFVDHKDFSQTTIKKLRGLGFTISMDDFGTGISTLNRLKDIHFDTLKLDRQFIVDSIDNGRSTKIIRNIIQMAKDLDLLTVAEGIETPEQLLFLRNMGCQYGQGFYFSKPLPEDEFLEILMSY